MFGVNFDKNEMEGEKIGRIIKIIYMRLQK